MTEKEALTRTLEYVESSFSGDMVKMKSARAFFVLAWLEDKNWHSEMQSLLNRVLETPYLNTAFKALEENDRETNRIYGAVSLMNYIFGWGLAAAEWKETQGPVLIEEIWNIINFKH